MNVTRNKSISIAAQSGSTYTRRISFHHHTLSPSQGYYAIVFGTNFGGIDVSFENSLSLRERARVRGSNEVYSSFFPSS
jgi:hypothetical protein